MIIAGKLLLSAFIALNITTPRVTPNKNDLRLSGGVMTSCGTVKCYHEIVSGMYYNGIQVKTSEFYRVEAELDINEGSQVNKQYLYVNILNLADIAKYLLQIEDDNLRSIFTVRSTNEWTYWQDYRNMYGFCFDFSNVFQGGSTITTFSWDSNFQDRHTLKINISFKLAQAKKEKMRLVPYFKQVYRHNIYDDREDMSFKPEIGVEFK